MLVKCNMLRLKKGEQLQQQQLDAKGREWVANARRSKRNQNYPTLLTVTNELNEKSELTSCPLITHHHGLKNISSTDRSHLGRSSSYWIGRIRSVLRLSTTKQSQFPKEPEYATVLRI